MRIFDETKTTELNECDLEKGYLKDDKLLVAHHDAVAAVAPVWHRKVVRTYPNGGEEVERVIDVPGSPARPAYDEYEDIKVYVPFTEEQLKLHEIRKLKTNLRNTDYKAIKYAEGELSAEEYAPIKVQRQAWRARINELGG